MAEAQRCSRAGWWRGLLLVAAGLSGLPEPTIPDLDGLHANCEEHWRSLSPAYVRPFDTPSISDCNPAACAPLRQRPLLLVTSSMEYKAIRRETRGLCEGLTRVPPSQRAPVAH